MTKIIKILAFLLVSTVMKAQSTEVKTEVKGDLEITVNVPNATSDKGTIMYALYEKNNFMGEPTASAGEKISEGKSSCVFKNLTAGEYGIILFHDSNANGTMDFDENGMPLEDYAVSNNPVSYGPPQFESAKFTLKESITIEIKL